MRLQKAFVFATAFAVILTTLAVTVVASKAGPLKKVNDIVTRLEVMGLERLVPDQVVVSALHDFIQSYGRRSFDANTYARHAVMSHHLASCFENNDQYWDAAYASYSGGEWYFENAGLPKSLEVPMNRARELIMDRMRQYLRDPANLRAFSAAKSSVVVAELQKLTPTDRENFRTWLATARDGMDALSTPGCQAALHDYRTTEKAWRATEWGTESSRIAFEAYEDHRGLLEKTTPDLYATLFADRRKSEGGEALVATYIELADRLLASLPSE